MDLVPLAFFSFLAAIIIVPQVLRYNERGRLHQTLRMAFERGQPVPPELIAALQWGRRRYEPEWDMPPEVAAGWRTRPAAAPGFAAAPPQTAPFEPAPYESAPTTPPPAAAGPMTPPPPAAAPVMSSMFPSQTRRDLRRGLIWLAVGLGLVAAGAAFYAGLYDSGGAPETFASFAAFGAIPGFVGLTYLGLWFFGREKTRA